jgi:hypothetical protein
MRLMVLQCIAALMIGIACGESSSLTKPSPASSPTVDSARTYKAVAAQVTRQVQKGAAIVNYCQPITPTTSRKCREVVVQLVADSNDAIGLLDAATVPEQFKTLHAALRASLVKAVALNSQAVGAIDSGNGIQAALDAALAQMGNEVFVVLHQIESA